jgi:hypothetical protein
MLSFEYDTRGVKDWKISEKQAFERLHCYAEFYFFLRSPAKAGNEKQSGFIFSLCISLRSPFFFVCLLSAGASRWEHALNIVAQTIVLQMLT